MNAIQMLAFHPLVERLGLTLVHFVWQGLSIAVLYEAARRSLSRAASPQARYLMACAALATMLAAPLVTWEIVSSAMIQRMAASPKVEYRIESTPLPFPSPVTVLNNAAPESARATAPVLEPRQFLPWVVMLWLIGSVFFWVRLAGGWMVAAHMRSKLVRMAEPACQELLSRLGARIGLTRPVRLLVSALMEAPTVVGWLRPVVLMPVGALAGLPAGHLEALLLHELAHIRRHDYLVNILQSIAEALLFYHPAVWWISGHIRTQRELCCDDMVVAVSGDALTYARALAQLESYRPAHLGSAVAATGGSLSDRIARLLGQPRPAVRGGMGPGVLAVAILLIAAAYGMFGQSSARPAFQSVSMKRNTSDWSQRFQHPMSMSTNASLKLLVRFAYAPHDNPMLGHSLPLLSSQVIGGPPWSNSEGYDIEVKPGANTDPKQWWPMWQTLLADRCKLKLHRETRQLPGYVMRAAQNGFKLPAARPADCVSFPPGTTPRHIPGKVDCGYVSGPFEGSTPGLHLEGRKVRMTDLIRELASVLDRPILDRTGFTGEFDLNLNFTPDESLLGMPPGYGGPGDPSLPNIFAALEQQLGLQLTSSKGPVEVLVIDQAERPTAN